MAVIFSSLCLNFREIVEVMKGSLPWAHAIPACRCPPSHPRILPGNDRFCIKNGVPDTSLDTVLRISSNAHPLQYANDGDPNSFWVSSFLDEIIFTLDMQNGQFQVCGIKEVLSVIRFQSGLFFYTIIHCIFTSVADGSE